MEKEDLSKFNDLMGDENSKEASRILYFSEKYGVSPYASSFLEKKHKIQVSKDLPDKFWIELENTHPNTVKYLNNPYGLRAISDDFDFMPFYESWAKQFVRGVKYNYLQYKLSDLLGKKYEYAKRNMSLLPEDEEKIKKIKEELREAEEHAPKPNKFRPIYYASQQSLNIGIPIAVGLGGGAIGTLLSPAGASAGFTAGFLGSVAKITYEQERNFAFDSYVNEYNIDPKKAVELANYVGMINSAIEVAGDYVLGELVLKPFGSATMRAVSKLPMGEKVLSYISKNKEIFSHMTLSEAVRKAVLSLSGTVASEVAQEYSQEVVTDVGAEIGRRSEGEQPQSIKEILNKASGVINPTIQASLLFGLTGALSNIYIGVKELREAEMTREFYLKLGKVSEKMKLRKMNPKEFEKFVNTAVEGTGVEKIYLDVDNAKKYFQSRGIDFGDVIKELGLQDKYDNPENINGYLEVPLGRWLSKVVGSEHYNNLVDHIKFDLEHYTNAELREMEAIAERNIENKINDLKSQVNPEWVENFNVVYNRVSSQLREIYGDKKEKLIDSQAKAFSYMVINEAVKRGISPESFLNEWNLPSITTIEGQIANEVYYKNVTDILNKTSKGEPVENDYIYNKTYNEFKEQDFPEIQKQAKIELDPKTLYKEIIKRAINDGVVLNEKVASQGVVKNLKNQLDVLSINKINEFANQYDNIEYYVNQASEQLGAKDIVVPVRKNTENKEVREVLDRLGEDANRVKAFFKNNKIYVITDNITPEEAQRVVYHEAIVHFGLRNALGQEKFYKLCRDVFENAGDYAQEIALKYGLDLNNDNHINIIGEEILAMLVERSVYEPEILNRIQPILRKDLAEFGFTNTFDVKTIRNIINSAKDYLSKDSFNRLENKAVNSIMYSLQSWEEYEEKILNKIKEYNKKNKDAPIDEKYVKELINRAKNFIKNKRPDLIYNPLREFRAVKKNSDPQYKLFVDFSTDCKRRVASAGTIAYAMQEYFKRNKSIMTKEQIGALKRHLENNGIQTSCSACYVEAKRLNIISRLKTYSSLFDSIEKGNFDLKSFIKENGLENKKKELESVKQLSEVYPEALKEIERYELDKLSIKLAGITAVEEIYNLKNKIETKKIKAPNTLKVLNILISGIRSLGPSGGKSIELRTDYRHEILKFTQEDVDFFNNASGLRLQSWSDFEIEHLIDLIQVTIDMTLKGLKGHAYTKVKEFVKLMKDTGLAINMSLIPKGNGLKKNGEIDIDHTQSFDFKEGLKYRDKYNNVGFIIIGVNREHILKSLDTDYIDMIIPYHSSGLSKELRNIYGMSEWKDYEKVQVEKVLPDGYEDFIDFDNKKSQEIFNKYDWFLNGKKVEKYQIKDRAKYINSNGEKFIDLLEKEFEKLTNSDKLYTYDMFNGDMNKYLEQCKKDRVVPKFYSIFQDNGESVINHKHYYKLIADRRTKDSKGREYKQKPMEFNFNAKDVMDLLKNMPQTKKVIHKELADEFLNNMDDKKLYQSPLYHGTAYDFDKFDINKIGSGEGAWVYGWGLYFAENKDVAKHYKKSTEDLIININGEEMRTKIIEDDVIKKICDLAGIDFNKNKMRVSFILNHYINKDFNWDAVRDLYKDNPENLDIVNRISKIMSAKGTGRIMEVGVKGSLKTILWDEGIEKQPPEVLEILQKNGFEIYPSSNIFPEGTISYEHNGKKIYATTGWELYEQLSRVMGGYKNTSKFLASIGIDGIKYKDEGSRLKTDRDSITYNYVIFNPDKIYISRKLKQKKRGYYDVARNVIALSVINSDPSTFMHESAHYFLEDMFNYVKSGKASDKYLKQWEAVKKFLNIKEDQKELTIEQHEKFAKEFEKYLLTSKFENEEIKSFMGYIKNTMSKIYRKFILGKITLNEDMKRFFDSMIVPENIVSSVVHEESSNDFGIDENSKIAEKFKIETANYIMHKLMDYYTSSRQEFLKKEEERIRGEIAKEVEDEPIFNAYDKIKEIIPKEKDVKEFLISKNFNKYEKYKLDVIAEIYGFSSREEMIKEILDNPTREEYIEAKLKEEMKKYDDLNNKEKLVEEVKEAFYKSAKMSIIKKEIEFIKSKLKDKELLNKFKENYLIESEKYQEIVESKARKYISKLPVNEAIRYENLRKYALKMREKSLRYYMKNDFVNALKYKKEEYYYTALSKEAKNVYKEYYLIIKNIKKIIGYLKKNKKEQRKIFYNEDNVYQVAKLVNRFGFVRNHFTIPVDTIPLAKWVEEMNKVTNVVDISEDLFDETKVKPYTSLTIDELRDVHDAMMNIIHTGKLMNMAYGMVSKLDKQMLKEEMKKSFENIKDKLAKDPKLTNKLSIIEKLKEFGNSINLNLATIDSLLYVLDGGERQGAWWRAIYKPINDASDLEAKMIQEAVEKIREIYSVYTKEELISMDKDLIYIDAIKQSLTKNEIMAIALNLGTESNKKRLMEGYGWDEGTIAKITQVLTKKDWDTIQKIWDFIGSYQDDIKSLYKDLTGFTPKMVDPIPVITPYGVYSGGYYPLYKNVKLDARGLKEMQEDRSLLEAPPVWKASTKNSHVKSRYANAKYPVSLDINVFKRHIYQVIHDLTFRKAVMEVNNLLADPEVRGMITKVFGTEGYGIFEDWIKSVAGNNPTPPMEWFERLFRWARKNAVVSTLFWRFSVMFQQFASFPVVLSYDKDITLSKLIKNASSLYTKMIVNYEGYQRLRNEVFRKSSYMASRSETFDRDLNTLFSQMFKNKKSLIDFSISGIAQFDMLVALPTWLTGYEVGLEKFNGNEEKAIDFADELVRKTQGSGFIKDLPKIMRGSELKRIFTMYYSYMNAMYNLFFVYAMEYRLGVTNTAKFLGKMLGLWVFPSVLSELLSIRYPDSDEDTEDKIKYWFKKIIAYPMQTIPFLRDIIDMLLDRTFGLKGGGYRITPLQDIGENLGNLISTIRKEDAEAMEKVEATTKIASFLVPYPQQFNILLFNFIDYLDGMKPSPKDLTKRRPKKER